MNYTPLKVRSLKPDAVPTQQLNDIDSSVKSTNDDVKKANALPVLQGDNKDKNNTPYSDTKNFINKNYDVCNNIISGTILIDKKR